MVEAGVEHLVVAGSNRFGPAVEWLSGWPTTTESMLLVGPEEPDVLLIQLRNHVPNARSLAAACDVRWGGHVTVDAAVGELRRRGGGRVGVMGPVSHRAHRTLEEEFDEPVDLDGAYVRMRLVKSEEEMAWVRYGVELTDRAIDALLAHGGPGLTVEELVDVVERAYVPLGGGTHIHFFAVTPMDNPSQCVPAQWPSRRRLRPGDAVTTELSASYRGYPGQALRTLSVAAEPNALHRRLYAVAEEAFEAIIAAIRPGAHPRDLVEASSPIEDAGMTIYDDLVHGFVGGYLPPVLGSRSRTLGAIPDLPLEEGMTVVVQPNVITPDERAGVQIGELVRVGPAGAERLHRAPRGFLRMG
ncbi:MAG TPA: M24 family metallopeptidase [Actinomycetota bacterium]